MDTPILGPLEDAIDALEAALRDRRAPSVRLLWATDRQPQPGLQLLREGRMSGYRTIVADPPWEQASSYANSRGYGKTRVRTENRRTDLPYGTMTLDEIKALPVASLAAPDAHLYLWTTQRYLRDSFDVCAAWGFDVAATMVWCKQPHAMPLGGAWPATLEFVHFARRGNLATIGKADKRWWTWPRRRGPSVKLGEKRTEGHSAKPEAFIDLVEQVSPGPYVELFARRARFGWDYWGDQSLGTASMEAA